MMEWVICVITVPRDQIRGRRIQTATLLAMLAMLMMIMMESVSAA